MFSLLSVCLSVCLSVNEINPKVVNQFFCILHCTFVTVLTVG